MLPKKQFNVMAMIVFAAIVGVVLPAPQVKNSDLLNVTKDSQEFFTDSQRNHVPVLMVGGNNKSETDLKYRNQARTDRNIFGDAVYSTNRSTIGNKVNNSVQNAGVIYIIKGTGNKSSTYFAAKTREKILEITRDNYGVEKTEANKSVHSNKTIGTNKGAEGSVVSDKIEDNKAIGSIEGTKFSSDVLNTTEDDGYNNTKSLINVKKNKEINIVDEVTTYVGGETRNSVKRVGVVNESSYPSPYHDEKRMEKKSKGDFFNKIFAIPINILQSIKTLLNLKHQINSTKNSVHKTLKGTSCTVNNYDNTKNVGNGEHVKTGCLFSIPKQIYDGIIDIQSR